MKAIISHDIDHIKVSEHLTKDLIIPKFIARSNIELFTGKISVSELGARIKDLLSNRWHKVPELIQFNSEMNVPATFFIGVKNGVGLSYNLTNAEELMQFILQHHCSLGIHGIAFDDEKIIKEEASVFSQSSGLKNFGIRMHYVRMSDNTLTYLANAGYTYDSSIHGMINPYKVGNMWEIPFQIMDGWIIENGKPYQTRNLAESIDATKKLIDESSRNGIRYLGIDFHDRYYCPAFNTWKKWYEWTVGYLIDNNIEMINFDRAVSELEMTHSDG